MNVFVKTEGSKEYELRPEFKEYKEFKVLERRTKKMEGDSDGRKKLLNRKELSFVYLYGYFGSTYKNYAQAEAIENIKVDIQMPDNWQPDEEVKQAVRLYNRLQKTSSWKSYKAVEDMEKSIRSYISIKNKDLEVGKMDPKTAKDFLSLSKELSELTAAKEALKVKLEKEHDNIHGLTGRKGRILNAHELRAPDFVKDL